MEKIFEFTLEDRSLMYNSKMASLGLTQAESDAFFEVCEVYGLNPLFGDILIQKFETKYGPKVSYIVTRDGLLKHAHRQNDFTSINAGVVHQNDYFEFDVANEVVQHRFGQDRGQIIGAWAVLKTKSRGNVMEFVNYHEYKTALGSKNDLWNKMPSSMIKKVAQSNAIRTAFPLGVQFSSEDEFIDFEEPVSPGNENKEQPSSSTLKNELKAAKEKASSKNENIKEDKITAQKDQERPLQEKESIDNSKVLSQKEEKDEIEPNTTIDQMVKTIGNEEVYSFVDSAVNVSPSNNQKFLKISVKVNGNNEMLFAAEENIELFDEFTEGVQFTAQVESHQGFKFVKGVNVLAVA